MSHTQTKAESTDALIGATLVFISAIAFSAKAIFIKFAYAYSVDAVTLMALRMLFATPFFMVLALLASQDKTTHVLNMRDWMSIIALGLAGMYFSQLFDFLGLEYVSASMERTILFLYPTFVVIITAVLARKAVGKREVLALVLSYLGIILVAVHEISFDNRADTFTGAGFVFISAMTYACYLVGSGPAIHKLGMRRFTGYTMVVSCIAVLMHFSLTHSISSLQLPMPVYLLGFAMAIVSTVLPIMLLNAGIKRIGGSKASLISSVGPISTLLLAVIFLNEVITVKQIIGIGLVLAGVLTITLTKEKKGG